MNTEEKKSNNIIVCEDMAMRAVYSVGITALLVVSATFLGEVISKMAGGGFSLFPIMGGVLGVIGSLHPLARIWDGS